MFDSEEKPAAGGGRPRTGWLCSYTPEEIIYAAGFEPCRLLPHEERSAGSDRLLPPTLCPFARQVAAALEEGAWPGLSGLVVANSCNAMLHLYNVLRERRFPFFVYLLDLPRREGAGAVQYFAAQLLGMTRFFAGLGHPVTRNSLSAALQLYRETDLDLERWLGPGVNGHGAGTLQHYELALEASRIPRAAFRAHLARLAAVAEAGSLPGHGGAAAGKQGLLLAGALPPAGLVRLFSELKPEFPVYLDSCAGNRYWHGKELYAGAAQGATVEEMLIAIARAYLSKPPCPRLFHSSRARFYRELREKRLFKGVIYHDLNFCDLSHYDYLLVERLLEQGGIPVLKIKTELGQQDLGQIRTRVEAFLEMIA